MVSIINVWSEYIIRGVFKMQVRRPLLSHLNSRVVPSETWNVTVMSFKILQPDITILQVCKTWSLYTVMYDLIFARCHISLSSSNYSPWPKVCEHHDVIVESLITTSWSLISCCNSSHSYSGSQWYQISECDFSLVVRSGHPRCVGWGQGCMHASHVLLHQTGKTIT